MENVLLNAIESFCADGQPDNVWRQTDDAHGTYVIRIENQMPTHIYALMQGSEQFPNMSIALDHIEDNIWIEGVDLWGFNARIEWDSFSPELLVNAEIRSDPWPSEVVHLLEHLAEDHRYFYHIHISHIAYT